MRLHRLELEGFGPFRERQVVDFDAFADDGLFLISGRTGAGKSSVLDGVCFALYGSAPRYENAERRLRSDHCAPGEPTRVSLEFTSAGRRWRATRSPEYERPKQRGTGMTIEPHRAILEERVGGEWLGRAARPVDVAHLLEEIVGLTQQQFLQVILLAQNRFAQFLLARNEDRQKLLRTLFGTKTYEGYAHELDARRKQSEQSIATGTDEIKLRLTDAERLILQQQLGPATAHADAPTSSDPSRRALPDASAADSDAPGDLIPVRLEAVRRGVDRASYRVATLVEARRIADEEQQCAATAHSALRALRDTQRERDRSNERLAHLESEAEAIAGLREYLERATRAEALRPSIDAAQRAEKQAASAAAAEAAALSEWRALGEETPSEPPDKMALADLLAHIDHMTDSLAGWSVALEVEQQLAELDHAVTTSQTRVTEIEEAMGAVAVSREPIPARLAELDIRIAEVAVLAGGAPSARAHLDEVDRRLAAAHDAAALAVKMRAAEESALSAGLALQRASTAVTALLQQRLSGHAGELAAALIDGEPCAVCGSTIHPEPAESNVEAVTDHMMVVAESEKEAAITSERAASEAAREMRAAAGNAAARAGGAGVDNLDSERTRARSSHEACAAAVTEHDQLREERRVLSDAYAAAAREHEALGESLSRARIVLASALNRAGAAQEMVETARGDAATVAGRVVDATARRACARDLVARAHDRRDTADSAQHASVGRDSAIARSGFSDVDDATRALVPAAVHSETRERIQEHETGLRAVKERLLEIELALVDAPDDVIDLDVSEAALIAARDRWSSAVEAAADASQVAARLAELCDQARSRHEEFAATSEVHAVLARLADTVAGRPPNTLRMTLESFVLAAELEEIVAAANLRLDDMSSGRYRLHHTDARAARNAASGLGLEIMDAYTGRSRPAQSLSGGETFLASLALALGLAEVVTARAGGVRLDTLFVDEGFGSLDSETLDLAMGTLDELRQGGRIVGVISHVETMKEQIPAQLAVEATPAGPSIIRQ